MKLGILESGKFPEELVDAHGAYLALYQRFLNRGDPAPDCVLYSVVADQFPDSVEECDAWLVTGSKHGVYDDIPFIPRLLDFIREAYAAGVPLIGVCFGHQAIAQALGGQAEKSAKGWGLGPHEYTVAAEDPAWAGAAPAGRMVLNAFHQDQVTQPPAEARVIASSPFCENAALAYGPAGAPTAISIQPHPEFSAETERALLTLRSGLAVPTALADPALAALAGPEDPTDGDAAAMARWMTAFLDQAVKRRAAERAA